MLIRNVVGQAAAASYHAAAQWKYWKVLVGRPTLRRGKSTGGRLGYPHRQSLGSIVYSCAHCTLSGCQTFSHSQERCICSPEFSEHSRMMVASESKHKRQNKRPEKFESIACETKDGTMIFTVKDSANVDALARISCARTRNNASATINLSTRMVKTARR